ncbi:hypothetical protein DL766_009046 [Monosporascus sp. MC13-8B]|nr:hypothetical protein DL763_000702 [Monosporascus cannonballus]RYP16781.1 hypothetical protein DL766_009046 [Monosporascus sp. MC13-8B]
MGGWGGGGGRPSWGTECEATTPPADLSHTVFEPPEGATYSPGDLINLSWQSGIRSDVLTIDGPPWAGGFHPANWQWSVYLQSENLATKITILENQNFTFGYHAAWKVLEDCSNTAINQTWTVPSSLEITTETVFNIVVVNVTNPQTRRSTTGPAFIIKATGSASVAINTASASSSTSEPPVVAATAAPTPEGGSTFSVSTATPTVTRSPLGETTQGQSLPGGAKAGIGVAVSVSALFFIFALLLFWKRRRRPETANPEAGRAELDGRVEKHALQAEAPVPRELATDSGEKAGPPVMHTEGYDPLAPRYPPGPVELPADMVVEMPADIPVEMPSRQLDAVRMVALTNEWEGLASRDLRRTYGIRDSKHRRRLEGIAQIGLTGRASEGMRYLSEAEEPSAEVTTGRDQTVLTDP